MRIRSTCLALIALVSLVAVTARAGDWGGDPGFTTYRPSVPISALARPASWLDPTHFHVTSSFSVGSGSGNTSALQVTSLSYQFRSPMWLNVSMGNSWGTSSNSSGAPFLEGLDFGFRPLPSMSVRFQYRDFRSPLQYDAFSDPSRLWPR